MVLKREECLKTRDNETVQWVLTLEGCVVAYDAKLACVCCWLILIPKHQDENEVILNSSVSSRCSLKPSIICPSSCLFLRWFPLMAQVLVECKVCWSRWRRRSVLGDELTSTREVHEGKGSMCRRSLVIFAVVVELIEFWWGCRWKLFNGLRNSQV